MSTPAFAETWTLTLVGLRPAWSGMGIGGNSRQSSVKSKSNDNAEAQRAQRKLLRSAGFGVEGGAAAGGGEGLAVGAEFGLLEEVAGGVEREMAVGELDAAAGVAGDVHVVRDHKDRVAGLVSSRKILMTMPSLA